MSRKMTYDEFLKLAKNRHNNKFIYNETYNEHNTFTDKSELLKQII